MAQQELRVGECSLPAGRRRTDFCLGQLQDRGALLNILPNGGHSVAWKTEDLATHFNTAIYKDGYLYGFDGRNEPDASLVCLELKTGKLMWRVNPEWEESMVIDGAQHRQTLGTFRGTLLWVDGKFLALGELGHLLWLDLTPKGFKQLSRAWLFALAKPGLCRF